MKETEPPVLSPPDHNGSLTSLPGLEKEGVRKRGRDQGCYSEEIALCKQKQWGANAPLNYLWFPKGCCPKVQQDLW